MASDSAIQRVPSEFYAGPESESHPMASGERMKSYEELLENAIPFSHHEISKIADRAEILLRYRHVLRHQPSDKMTTALLNLQVAALQIQVELLDEQIKEQMA